MNKNTKRDKLRIVIPNKGRMYEPSVSLLRNVGLDFEIDERKLTSLVTNFDIEIMYASVANIPEFVQDGVADLGITGYDRVCEGEKSVDVIEKLHFGYTDLVIAVPDDSEIKTIKDLNGLKIATSFVNTTSKFLKENNISAEIIPMDGAVEVAPQIGLSDAIADLSSSGASLRMNNLRKIETIIESEAVLIANKDSDKHYSEEVAMLKIRFESVLTAQKKKYILLNAPEALLPQIKEIAPGLASPTIMKLSQEGMIAVHSVINSSETWMVIEKLKKIGATGILIMPIEKMIA